MVFVIVLNSLSNDLTKIKTMSKLLQPPAFARKCSWNNRTGFESHTERYWLMSMAGCWTNFHIDFAGSSVFYVPLGGAKAFWLVPPTEANLKGYARWLMYHPDQFFPDMLKSSVPDPTIYKLNISAGQAIFIPTGWIHAVYTQEDSIVFGGNFLQSARVDLQRQIHDLDLKLEDEAGNANNSYLFPHFEFINLVAMLCVVYDRSAYLTAEHNSTDLAKYRELLDYAVYVKSIWAKWKRNLAEYQQDIDDLRIVIKNLVLFKLE